MKWLWSQRKRKSVLIEKVMRWIKMSSVTIQYSVILTTPGDVHWTIKNNSIMGRYYTEFEHYDHVMILSSKFWSYSTLFELFILYILLSSQDQFFLVMIKLKQGKMTLNLFTCFKLSSKSTVWNIIVSWNNFMFFYFIVWYLAL